MMRCPPCGKTFQLCECPAKESLPALAEAAGWDDDDDDDDDDDREWQDEYGYGDARFHDEPDDEEED